MINDDIPFVKKKVQGFFDLQATAEYYNITSTDLVNFHNSFCSISELLPSSLPKHVDYIYLPRQKFYDRDVKELKTNVIDFPQGVSNTKYGVTIKFSTKNIQLHYVIDVKKNQGFLEITKKKTYKNNQEIQQTIEQLFEKAEESLYPLHISTDKNGELKRILNANEISRRWINKSKPELTAYYQSEIANKIINQLNSIFDNIDNKRDLLKRNLFYKLFFLPVYRSYPQFSYKGLTSIYFAPLGRSVDYEVEFNLQKDFTRGDKIALQLSGTETEMPVNSKFKKGEIDILYKFDKITKEIFSITGTLSAFKDDTEHQISFELFDLERNS